MRTTHPKLSITGLCSTRNAQLHTDSGGSWNSRYGDPANSSHDTTRNYDYNNTSGSYCFTSDVPPHNQAVGDDIDYGAAINTGEYNSTYRSLSGGNIHANTYDRICWVKVNCTFNNADGNKIDWVDNVNLSYSATLRSKYSGVSTSYLYAYIRVFSADVAGGYKEWRLSGDNALTSNGTHYIYAHNHNPSVQMTNVTKVETMVYCNAKNYNTWGNTIIHNVDVYGYENMKTAFSAYNGTEVINISGYPDVTDSDPIRVYNGTETVAILTSNDESVENRSGIKVYDGTQDLNLLKR